MQVPRRPATSTLAAVAAMVTLTAVFAVYALRQLLTIDPSRRTAGLTSSEVQVGLNPQTANNATAIITGLILAMCGLMLVAAVGVVWRKPGARHVAILLSGMFALLSLVSGISGLSANPPAPNAWYGVAAGIANAGVVALLLAPATADDFDRVDHERRWQRARGEALRPRR